MNFKLSFRRGFTLIEMLVVVAIIAVLAGIVLTGVAGFQARGRDSKRVADLRVIQNYIELYNAKWGHYPGGYDGVVGAAVPSSWTNFQLALRDANANVTLPTDPTNTKSHAYYYKPSANGTAYLLGSKLEVTNSALGKAPDVDSIPTGVDGTTVPSVTDADALNCTATLDFCVTS